MDVIVERDQEVKMRDGTVLRADVYRPQASGRFPTAMMRIPYGKDGARASAVLDPVAAAASGLAVVVQDTRGQGGSEGSAFYPFRDDFHDGFDTCEWIAGLPFSNGRVGAYGVSYGGNSSWQVGVARAPSLGAIAPIQSPIDWVDGWKMLTRNGVLKWGLTLNWTLVNIAESQVRKYSRSPEELSRRLEALADQMDDFDEIAARVPLTSVADAVRELVGPGDTAGDSPLAYLDDVLHRRPPPSWESLDLERSHSRIGVPAFIVASWYDVILGHDLDHFARMRQGAATPEARAGTRLLVGPWSHSNFTNVVGALDYGRRSMGASLDLGPGLSATLIEWFTSQLGSGDAGEPEGPRVRLFVQGVNRWRDEDDWPLAAARPEPWYLHAGGGLSPERPSADAPDASFVFDPRDPCPTCGGDLARPPDHTPGPLDQAPILGRRDVLVYTSPVLERDVTVIGPIAATLHAATTGRGTDWAVKLCDVDERGRTFNICDGIARVGPEEPGPVDIDLWGAAVVFRAGHRMRVLVTSSDFPRYERNPNTGEDPWTATRFEPCLQRVFHDAARASSLQLPVIG